MDDVIVVLLALLVGVVADAAAAAVAFLERCIVVKVDTLRSDDVVVCHLDQSYY